MRSRILTCVLLLSVSVGTSATLEAQERGTVGVNLSVRSSPNVGLTVYVSERVAVRPALQFSHTIQETFFEIGGQSSTRESKDTEGGLLFDILINVARIDRVDLYIGAGVVGRLVRRSYTGTGGTVPGGWPDEDWSGKTISPRGLFGVDVAVIEHLSIFGEYVMEYYIAPLSDGHKARRFSVGTSALGVIVHL